MPNHYENFPVASLLLPAHLRPAVRAIYAFARKADDFADEGTWNETERLQNLATLRDDLHNIAANKKAFDPVMQTLAHHVHQKNLPLSACFALLDAFEQDVHKKRYAHFGEVMEYCRRSANPVGHLMLHLFDIHDRRALAYADAICSSLQLTNFLQDLDVDWAKGRCYLPQNEWEKFGLNESILQRREPSPAWQRLIHHQIERIRRLLHAGTPLLDMLQGRLAWELTMVVLGGEHILKRLHDLDRTQYFHERPVIKRSDVTRMLVRSVNIRWCSFWRNK